MRDPRFSIIPAGAVTDARLGPRDLQVLCLLGRHTDDKGWCIRSQVKMSRELSCGRATVQRSLERLDEAGWIEHRPEIRSDGGDQAHYYRVILDTPTIAAIGIEPVKNVEESTEESEGGVPTGGQGVPALDEQGVPTHERAPIRTTPINEEVEREARAGEAEKPLEPSAADRKRFDDAVTAHWPNAALDDSERGFSAWWGLNADRRQPALDRIPDFVALHKSKKRDHLPALSTYFRQARFEALPPKPADGGGLSIDVPARSEAWCALFFTLALSERTQALIAARRMLAEAEFDKSAWRRADEIPSAAGWPKIERTSEQFQAWRKHLGGSGIWLKPEAFGVWLWVPSEWPQEDVKTARAG